mmetsp:Transcript_67384/g.156432  ORF Transcript_67384/g.156432 Transcript_67384/m.156432 type:complete len:343 (+) Transcript_67384:80-1108(+)|eukprot:CAMPEP_0171151130 /NCGR_PEP_ID=MMETSP0766_2-20121228/149915_1 /TAXON_ID=439317 /ORGANISM="Gambierdiscus australes, Strain CAWD 149" /LENGTH=342 /DNA_ID=CAMNT_0011615043 /DNA_START=14 /DNA_END=1042 /DNA_ORIENTATION=+
MPLSDPAAEKELNRLRRLPENRVCPNCLKEERLGFTDVCMPFRTFVCSDCKSAHQSFSHRVKCTAQSAWQMEEVRELDEKRGGGNSAACKRWLANVPESERPTADSTLDVKKRFVERAYMEERWAGGDRNTKDASSGHSKKGHRRHRHRDRHHESPALSPCDGPSTWPDAGSSEAGAVSDGGFAMPGSMWDGFAADNAFFGNLPEVAWPRGGADDAFLRGDCFDANSLWGEPMQRQYYKVPADPTNPWANAPDLPYTPTTTAGSFPSTASSSNNASPSMARAANLSPCDSCRTAPESWDPRLLHLEPKAALQLHVDDPTNPWANDEARPMGVALGGKPMMCF